MENIPQQEHESRPPTSSKEQVKRSLRNKLMLSLAFGVGLFAAQGAGAGEVGKRYGEAVKDKRARATEQCAVVDSQNQKFETAEAEFRKLEEQIAIVRAQYRLTSHLVMYSERRDTKGWGISGTSQGFYEYTASPQTPEDVRQLIAKHRDAGQRSAQLRIDAFFNSIEVIK